MQHYICFKNLAFPFLTQIVNGILKAVSKIYIVAKGISCLKLAILNDSDLYRLTFVGCAVMLKSSQFPLPNACGQNLEAQLLFKSKLFAIKNVVETAYR